MQITAPNPYKPTFPSAHPIAGLNTPYPASIVPLTISAARAAIAAAPRFSAGDKAPKKLVPDDISQRWALARKVEAGFVETLLILTGHPLSKASRVELFRQELAEKPPAHNVQSALHQLADALKIVEDKYAPPEGAMAPLKQEKYLPEVFGKIQLMRGDSFKHIILINEHGALEIRHKKDIMDNPNNLCELLRRPLMIAKDSADGYSLWNRPELQ